MPKPEGEAGAKLSLEKHPIFGLCPLFVSLLRGEEAKVFLKVKRAL